MSKQVHKRGLDHPMATVPFEDIKLMRQLHAEGIPRRVIAEKFEVKPDTLTQWLNYRYRAFK
jgi:uncharacterized protein YjcR